ncbi:hypothetical protein CIG19_14410 [Enterobacterales bacterium CwR94]|nr:hypothetical protein CIG19_14410 [Enterobacterales bacterium CwR94]
MKLILLAVVCLVIATLGWSWPYLKLEFASSAYYSQSNLREYEYYTPKLLKQMPRISPEYSFQYISNHDSKRTLHGIHFAGTTDTGKIKSYLKSEGYQQQMKCDTAAECWGKEGSREVVSLYALTSPEHVVVQITSAD